MSHRLAQYLTFAVQNRASDIHFSAEECVRLRVDGDLLAIEDSTLNNKQLQEILFEALSVEERQRLQSNRNLDKSFYVPEVGPFRMNIFYNRKGIAAVMRTIPTKIPNMQDLGLPPVVQQLAELNKGLVLVTGPTGSGKSTTLAAMIDYINRNFPCHILTIEDPVEFIHNSKQCLVNQREIGASCNSFADALKYALREDPDVILIGEMRDLETISLALTAAETGHLVFGTLHTRGAAASIDRIIDSFPSGQQAMIRTMLSESLMAVISQALLKRADGKGRVAAYEVMVVNHAISNLIREGKVFQIESIMQTGRKEGMVLMEQNIRKLLDGRIVEREMAMALLAEISGSTEVPKALNTSAPLTKSTASTLTAPPGPQFKVAAKPAAAAPASAPKLTVEVPLPAPEAVQEQFSEPEEEKQKLETTKSVAAVNINDLVNDLTIDGEEEIVVASEVPANEKPAVPANKGIPVPQPVGAIPMKKSQPVVPGSTETPPKEGAETASSKKPFPPPLPLGKKAG